MNKSIPPNVRLIAPPLLALIGILIAGFFVFRLSFSQITKQNQKIKEVKAEKNALSEKESILSGVRENILPTADLALVVLPTTNTSLAAISQIKTLVNEKSLIMTNLNVASSGSEATGFKKATLNFDLVGPSVSIIDFASSITTVAPLMVLDGYLLSNEGEVAKATVSVGSFWADLPTSFPGVSEGASNLTEEEVSTLSTFANLRLPVFSSLKPQPGIPRADPFN